MICKKQSIYDFEVIDNKNNLVSLSKYKGKILLICNTAIHCQFTPTYKNLEFSYLKYHSAQFEILDFPCNQFHGQASESDEFIDAFCTNQYKTTFPRFKKIDVNGENASPLFLYLQKQKKFQGFDKGSDFSQYLSIMQMKENINWLKDNSIKWNFTKFLVDRNGKVVKRFECTAPYSKVEQAIEKLIDTQIYELNK